jgi:osmotically-inducible protein OsmY
MGKAKDIREAAEEELGHDRLLDGTGITVRNLHGNVALTGTVLNYPQYMEAAEAARRVAGVTRVTRLVKEALDRHAVPLDDSHVVARASGNTVTLIGHVRTPAQRDAAAAAAWRGHAVMAVINELDITS